MTVEGVKSRGDQEGAKSRKTAESGSRTIYDQVKLVKQTSLH